MKTRLSKIIKRTHFIALTIAILNSLFKNFMVFSLASEIELGIKILVIISGLLLFFLYRKSLEKFKLYFSVYPLAVLFILIGLIFRGIIAGLILSIILFPIIPNEKEFEAKGVIITTPFQGFIAACCSYQIKERRLWVFEKDYGFDFLGTQEVENANDLPKHYSEGAVCLFQREVKTSA